MMFLYLLAKLLLYLKSPNRARVFCPGTPQEISKGGGGLAPGNIRAAGLRPEIPQNARDRVSRWFTERCPIAGLAL